MYAITSSVAHLQSPTDALVHLGTFAAKQLNQRFSHLYSIFCKRVGELPAKFEKEYIAHLPEVRRTFVKQLWRVSAKELTAYDHLVQLQIEAIHKQHPSKVSREKFFREEGCHLDGVSIINPEYNAYIVYFGGVRYNWMRSFSTLWQLHTSQKANIISYNYRGTMPSCLNDPHEEAIIEDGKEIVLDLMRHGVPLETIELWGRSLGGGISFDVADRLDDLGHVVNLTNERSFSSLLATIANAVPFVGKLFSNFVNGLQWQSHSAQKLAKYKGRLTVIYHEKDLVIPIPVAFKTAIDAAKFPNLRVKIIRMQDDVPLEIIRSRPRSQFTQAHCRNFTADELIEIFIARTGTSS